MKESDGRKGQKKGRKEIEGQKAIEESDGRKVRKKGGKEWRERMEERKGREARNDAMECNNGTGQLNATNESDNAVNNEIDQRNKATQWDTLWESGMRQRHATKEHHNETQELSGTE